MLFPLTVLQSDISLWMLLGLLLVGHAAENPKSSRVSFLRYIKYYFHRQATCASWLVEDMKVGIVIGESSTVIILDSKWLDESFTFWEVPDFLLTAFVPFSSFRQHTVSLIPDLFHYPW